MTQSTPNDISAYIEQQKNYTNEHYYIPIPDNFLLSNIDAPLTLANSPQELILHQSNFDAIQTALEKINPADIEILIFGDVKYLAFNSANTVLTAQLIEIETALEEYPVIDDDDYYNAVQEQIDDDFDYYGCSELCNLIEKHFTKLCKLNKRYQCYEFQLTEKKNEVLRRIFSVLIYQYDQIEHKSACKLIMQHFDELKG